MPKSKNKKYPTSHVKPSSSKKERVKAVGDDGRPIMHPTKNRQAYVDELPFNKNSMKINKGKN